MQDCFRKYPDVYGAEIADEEAAEHEAEQLALDTPTPSSDAPAAPKTERKMAATPSDTDETPAAPAVAAPTEPAHHESPKVANPSPAAAPAASSSSSSAGKTQDKQKDADAAVGRISEERGVPEKAFDATGANNTHSK